MSGQPDPPIPYDDRKIKRNWVPEKWDHNLPKQRGFVTDMVLALRGTKVPTSFAVWTAISSIASAIKREAWVEWGIQRLFSNFYIILVAPPSVCGKDTVISFMERTLFKVKDNIWSDNLRIMKDLKIIRHRGTKEFIEDELRPSPHGRRGYPLYQIDTAGKHIQDKPIGRIYETTSEALIIAPELGHLLGKEKFNEGMIEFLTHIYTTHDNTEAGTRGNGKVVLHNLCTNMIAGTQPDAIRDSLPKAAYGEGFLSRCIVVFHDRAARFVPIPSIVQGAPDEGELGKRLAWIAENAQGRYSMSDGATRVYLDFAEDLHNRLLMYPEWIGLMGRMDTNLMKLSMVMRAQRYERGTTIEKSDVEDAQRILDDAVRTAPMIAGMIHGSVNLQKYKTVARYIAGKKKGVDRLTVIRNTSHGITGADVTTIVNELSKRSLIEIRLDKRTIPFSEKAQDETYLWIGDQHEVP